MITVLYVDDEPELLEITRDFLEQDGEFQVRISTSAREVLDSGTVPSCDAIVSDYQMPEMDGIAFLKEVRERFADLPFILFTGRGREEVAIEALNFGADFYIQKGGEPRAQFAELSNKIRYAVSRKRAEKELQRKNDELNASYEQIAANEEELRQQLDELTGKQDALKDSEEKFRAFTENVPDLTTIVDRTGVYTYISPSVQRITGWTGDKLLGKKFQEIDAVFGLLPEDAEILLKRSRMAIQKPGEVIPVPPFRIRDFRGDTLFIEGTITYLPDVKGIQGILFHGRDISDRKRTEQTLAESEERYRTLIEMSPVAVIVHRDGTILYVNPETVRLAKAGGVSDLIGKDVLSFIHPDDRPMALQHFLSLSEGKTIPPTEERLLALDGEEFIVEIAAQPIRFEGVQAVLVVFRDITSRKRTEQTLTESEERYRTLVDSSFDGIAIHQDGKLVFVNQTGVRMMGLSDPAGLIGRPAIEIIHPDDRALIAERIRVSPEQSLEFIHERFLRADGSIIHVDVASTPCTWQGRPATHVTFRDISTQKKAEEALRESEENYRSLIELAPVAVVVHRDGKNVYANPEAFRMIKAKVPGDIIGKDILTFVNPAYHERTVEAVKRMAESGISLPRQEQGIIAVDGEELVVEISAKPISFQGHPSVMVLMRDITQRKKTEEALFNSQQMLQSVLDTIPQRVFWKDLNSVYLGCNKPLAQDAGVSDPSEMIGKTDFDNAFRETADLYRADDHRVMETGQARINYEEPQVRPDGSKAWLRTSKMPLRGKDGNVFGVLGTYEDITEYKRSQEALKESEEKYRTLVENAHEAIAIVQDWKIVFVNQRGADMLGSPVSSIEGRLFMDFIWPEDRDPLKDRHGKRISGASAPETYDFRITGAVGRPVWVSNSTADIFWEGKPASLSLMTDITERKFAERH